VAIQESLLHYTLLVFTWLKEMLMCLMRIFSFFEVTSMILITLFSHVAVLEQYTAHVAIREQSLMKIHTRPN